MKKTRVEDLPTWQEIQEQERIDDERARMQHTSEGLEELQEMFYNPTSYITDSYVIGIDPISPTPDTSNIIVKSSEGLISQIQNTDTYGAITADKMKQVLRDMFSSAPDANDYKKIVDPYDVKKHGNPNDFLVKSEQPIADEYKWPNLPKMRLRDIAAVGFTRNESEKMDVMSQRHYSIMSTNDCRGKLFDMIIINSAFDKDKAQEIIDYINKYCKV